MLRLQQMSIARGLGTRAAACALRALEPSGGQVAGQIIGGGPVPVIAPASALRSGWPSSLIGGRSFAAGASTGIPYGELTVGG